MSELPIQRDVSLKALNTLALEAQAAHYLRAETVAQLRDGLDWARARALPVLVLGGGSNIILRGDWPGLVLHVALRGMVECGRDSEHCWLDVAAGEPWHPFVRGRIDQGHFGVENLALIPGTVGAAPVQNIGAYGVEVKSLIKEVEILDRASGELRVLNAADCAFGYRDSVFKGALRDHCVITRVRFALDRQFSPQLDYGPVRQALGEGPVTALAVAEAVERIRRAKLPDPAQLPNAGSFFKNPVVDAACLEALLGQYPAMPHYPQANGRSKLAAGWLIEQAGWKGYRHGAVGVHSEQALVLVNHGGATGADVLALAASIRDDVAHKFGVELEIEPQVY